ncbi:MAG: exodeoxyribonuclease III [Vampirovibrio sp.]
MGQGNTYRLISWNVNGIRAAFRKGFLDWLASERPDVLCLQETKIQAHQLTEDMMAPPEGYHAYYSHATRPGYSGVAIWSRIEPLNVVEGFGVEAFDCEGRTLMLEFEEFILYGMYYPNGASSVERLRYKMEFYDAFLEGHIKPLQAKTTKPIVLTGDFNTAHHAIDLARPKDNEKVSGFLPEERAWLDRLLEAGFLDTFRLKHPDEAERYTWWAMRTRARERNVGWRIDYFFASEALCPYIVAADIHDHTEGSDHAPVYLALNFPT